MHVLRVVYVCDYEIISHIDALLTHSTGLEFYNQSIHEITLTYVFGTSRNPIEMIFCTVLVSFSCNGTFSNGCEVTFPVCYAFSSKYIRPML